MRDLVDILEEAGALGAYVYPVLDDDYQPTGRKVAEWDYRPWDTSIEQEEGGGLYCHSCRHGCECSDELYIGPENPDMLAAVAWFVNSYRFGDCECHAEGVQTCLS